jgi:hypothetical protein
MPGPLGSSLDIERSRRGSVFLNASSNLLDLFVRMSSGVAVVRNQLFDRPEFDFGADSQHSFLVEGVKNFLYRLAAVRTVVRPGM